MDREYKPNSKRFKEEQKEREKLEKVVTGVAKRRKKSKISKIADAFRAEDARKIGDHALLDVLVPTIKRALADVAVDSVNMLLFGDTKSRGQYGPSRYVAYDSRFSGGGGSASSLYKSDRPRSSYNFDEVIVDSRGEAEVVMERLNELLLQYGIVRVADLYELAGMRSEYTDNKYGWTSLKTADIVHCRDGYLLKMPPAKIID